MESLRGLNLGLGLQRTTGVAYDLAGLDAEIDFDFRSGQSYPGSGTTVSSMQTAPASGASQSDYDFTLPMGWSFTDGYVAGDGASYMEITGANTAFLNGLNRTDNSTPWGLAVVFYPNSTTNSRMVLEGRGASVTNPGFVGYFASTNSAIPAMFQRGDAGGFGTTVVGSTQMTQSAANLCVWTWDKTNNDARLWVNGTQFENTSVTLAACETNGQKITIGGSPFSANNYIANGERIYQWILFRRALSTSDEASIRSALETRTGLTF